MTAAADVFSIPREQFLSWKYWRLFANPQTYPGGRNNRRVSFFWARNALYHGLGALKISKGAEALLPAYVCRAAVEPFEAYGINVRFYDVRKDCIPDFGEIEAAVTPRTEAVLAVHYFGFPQKIQRFRDLCNRRHLALFEDCAHVLSGLADGHPQGGLGDVSVFSYRKFLPMYDGADVQLRLDHRKLAVQPQKESLSFSLRAMKHIVAQKLERPSSFPGQLLSGILTALKKIPRPEASASSASVTYQIDNNSPSFDISLLDHSISRPSRWVLRHSDLSAVIRDRRLNFNYLAQKLHSLPGCAPLHSQLPDNVGPWVYPLFFDTLPNAHLRLRELGIPAVTWGGVRPPVIDHAQFGTSDWLYDHLVFLPIHQNLSQQDLDRIAKAVEIVSAKAATTKMQPMPLSSHT